MLQPEKIDPEKTLNMSRRKLLEYVEKFGRWARRLNDEDLRTVCMFAINVQNAWVEGQGSNPIVESAAEAVQMGLPGLGGDGPFNVGSRPDYNPDEPVGLEAVAKGVSDGTSD